MYSRNLHFIQKINIIASFEFSESRVQNGKIFIYILYAQKVFNLIYKTLENETYIFKHLLKETR